MHDLRGLGVLVTRPEAQAESLCRLLERHGAVAHRLPALGIEPLAATAAGAAALVDADLIIFVSANAVRHGAALLTPGRSPPLAAIGPATARALIEAGHSVAIAPAGGFDSERLLAETQLRHPAGRRIVIVKGSGGRDQLERELGARGAAVRTIEVYRRRPATPTPQRLRAVLELFEAGAVGVVTATSLEIGAALLGMADARLRGRLEGVHWLVPGERVAAGLAGLGLGAPLLRAASAADQDLVDALLGWRGGGSSA